MKKLIFFSVALMSVILMSCNLFCKGEDANSKKTLETPKDRHSYAIGYNMGKEVKRAQTEAELDASVILQAIKDQLDSTKPALMNDSQVMAAIQEFVMEMQKSRIAKDSIKAVENLATQNTFLEKNKSEAGVAVTESGLQYIKITEGSGDIAKDGDTVSVHYVGTLLDGTEFGSSIKYNSPMSIVLEDGKLIKGWVEMLRLMKKGDKVKVWIPSVLAYGDRGNEAIPGNSLLIFEMELLDIKTAK